MMAPTPITQALEHLLEAAWHRTAVLNRRMIGLAHSNLRFGFELARAKTLSDVLSLQADYWQEQWNVFQADEVGDELSEAVEPRRAETVKPQRAETAEPPRAVGAQPLSRAQEPVPPQTETPQADTETVEIPVLVDAPEKPKQEFKPKPVPKAASPEPHGGKKNAKGTEKPSQGRQPPSEARSTERKPRAGGRDAVSPSGTAKIQFGMLDGNAVRFTGTEAWALLEGAWRKVSVDDVLSDAVVLSQARYAKLYPEVPELPASAFRPKGKHNR
jgi:hypothetical protein